MKKFSTLLLSSLFSLSLLAYDGSRLSISTASNNMNLQIEIDGSRFLLQNNSLVLRDLSEGYHQVKIFQEGRKNIFDFGRRNIIYSNSIYLKKGFDFAITINQFGTAMVDERRIDQHEGWYYENNNNSSSGNDFNEGSNNNSDIMSDREFDQVKYAISKEWFENNRLISAKTIMDNNSLTTCQVKELMQLFSFESNKLEVAKYAYRKTTDKQNYYQLNDAFTFSSSKEELARFIRECR